MGIKDTGKEHSPVSSNSVPGFYDCVQNIPFLHLQNGDNPSSSCGAVGRINYLMFLKCFEDEKACGSAKQYYGKAASICWKCLYFSHYLFSGCVSLDF